MRMIFKTAIIAAGVVLLGTSLAFSSAGIVSGASQAHDSSSHAQPAAKSCDTSKYCLTEDNNGTGGGISASGVIGVNATGGSCSICSGVYSTAAGYGVYASATNSSPSSPGYGVYGISPNFGVYGEATSSDGIGVNAVGGPNGEGLAGSAPGANAWPLFSGGSSGDFNTDQAGDGFFDGYVEATSFKDEVPARSGPVSASVTIAPRPTIEDTGTARMSNGVSVVHFASDFASTLDISQGYQVFLTPDGETRGWLYVAQKYEGGFIVREAEHGRSSVDFDYRVVAHPMGTSNQRFPAYTPPRRPRLFRLPTHGPAQPPTFPSGK